MFLSNPQFDEIVQGFKTSLLAWLFQEFYFRLLQEVKNYLWKIVHNVISKSCLFGSGFEASEVVDDIFWGHPHGTAQQCVHVLQTAFLLGRCADTKQPEMCQQAWSLSNFILLPFYNQESEQNSVFYKQSRFSRVSRDLRKALMLLFLRNLGSKALDEVEGPWKAQCQLKKQIDKLS